MPCSSVATCSHSSTTSTSPMARCLALLFNPWRCMMAFRLWLRCCGYKARDSRTVQSVLTRKLVCSRANSPSKKPWSKGALCATSTAPSSISSSRGTTLAKVGASCTIWLLMPVRFWMKKGIGVPGLSSVLQRAAS